MNVTLHSVSTIAIDKVSPITSVSFCLSSSTCYTPLFIVYYCMSTQYKFFFYRKEHIVCTKAFFPIKISFCCVDILLFTIHIKIRFVLLKKGIDLVNFTPLMPPVGGGGGFYLLVWFFKKMFLKQEPLYSSSLNNHSLSTPVIDLILVPVIRGTTTSAPSTG